MIKEWNNLPPHMKNAMSYEQFSQMLSTTNRPPQKYYMYEGKKTLINHTKLQVECSNLNMHLYVRNLASSPECQCGEWTESVRHYYLLRCPFLSKWEDTTKTKTAEIKHCKCWCKATAPWEWCPRWIKHRNIQGCPPLHLRHGRYIRQRSSMIKPSIEVLYIAYDYLYHPSPYLTKAVLFFILKTFIH